VLEHANRVAELHRVTRRDVLDSAVRRARTHQLADIGIALSAQRDPVKLLETLLTQARQLADCDAGSLYLIEEIAGVRSLHFKLAQNDTASVPFKEARLPLTTDSLSGYVALTAMNSRLQTRTRSMRRSHTRSIAHSTNSSAIGPGPCSCCRCVITKRVIRVLQFINRRNRAPKELRSYRSMRKSPIYCARLRARLL
jgi:hypothetical protein